MPRLEFSRAYSYQATTEGIPLPVVLRTGTETVDLLAYVDTGASNCLFERKQGEMLNLSIEDGEPKAFRTANGRLDTFGHVVSLETLDLWVESMVYFFADPGINKNLLGRSGWLDRVRLGLVEHDQRLYLASYDLESR
jgi:predicted aspartyl protease